MATTWSMATRLVQPSPTSAAKITATPMAAATSSKKEFKHWIKCYPLKSNGNLYLCQFQIRFKGFDSPTARKSKSRSKSPLLLLPSQNSQKTYPRILEDVNEAILSYIFKRVFCGSHSLLKPRPVGWPSPFSTVRNFKRFQRLWPEAISWGYLRSAAATSFQCCQL